RRDWAWPITPSPWWPARPVSVSITTISRLCSTLRGTLAINSLAGGRESENLDIVTTYESDVANAPSGFRACVNAACQYLDALLTDPITVRIQVGYGTIDGQPLSSGALGESSASFQFGNYGLTATALQRKGAPGSSSLPAAAPNG